MFHDPNAFSRLRDRMREPDWDRERVEVPPLAELIARIEAARRKRDTR